MPEKDKKPCQHEQFEATTTVNRLQNPNSDHIDFCADIKITCSQCKLPFRFIGLPTGLDLRGAAVSYDGMEARLAIAPKGEVSTVVGDPRAVRGFTIRRTQ